MSKSDSVVDRKAESVIPRSVRRAEKQVDRVLRELKHCYSDEILDGAEELEAFETRVHLNRKQTLR